MSSSTFLQSILNSTMTQTDLLTSNITTASETVNAYDYQGAAFYIAVILVWYSTGLAMMLFLQVRPRPLQQQSLFDSSNSSRKSRSQSIPKNPFTNYRNIQADNTKKQILNELKDPERRQQKQNEPDSQYYQTITSDGATINRINKKLAYIHRMDSTLHEISIVPPNIPPTNDNRPSAMPIFDSKFFAKRFPSLRRPGGSTTTAINTPPPLIRAHSQTDTTSANITVEMEPLVSGKQLLVSSTNSSRKRNNLSPKRFTVEKVSDSENTSE